MGAAFFAEFHDFMARVKKRGNKAVVLVDSKVASLYQELFEGIDLPWIALKEGELAKCREEKERVEDYLLSAGFGKDAELVAFGGGATLDLCGFIASTYMRGIQVSFVPTTIIALVDASIGGKNGINTAQGKNLLGTFYDPVDCCLCTKFFDTLSKKEQEDQYAEVVKMAALCGKDLLEGDSFEKAREAKEAIVQRDRREKGERAILNFGHTFAHAYEQLFNFEVSHGSAVWMGMHFAARLSNRLGLLKEEDLAWIKSFGKAKGRPFDAREMYEAMKVDKKNRGGVPYFVLLEGIGKPYQREGLWAHPVEEKQVIEVLEEIGESLCAQS